MQRLDDLPRVRPEPDKTWGKPYKARMELDAGLFVLLCCGACCWLILAYLFVAAFTAVLGGIGQ